MTKPDPQSYQLPLLPDVTFGAYPGHFERTQAVARVNALCQAGITCFIDLTEERDGLYPYMTLVLEVSNVGKAPVYLRFPIRDMSVPATPADLLPVLDALDDAVAAGHSVYLHCWGGIGRTGMVAGCYLVRHGLTGELALKELNRAFAETPLGREGRESPETDLQRRFVLEWAKHDPKAKWPGPPDYEFRARRYARLLIAEAGGDMEQARRMAEKQARTASLDGPQWAGQVWARVVEYLTPDPSPQKGS